MEKDFDFISIDFETANLNMNSVCSIGVVAVKDLEIVSSFYSLIKPPDNQFHYKNTEIHGLTYEDVKSSPIFPDVWEYINKLISSSKYVIAHNAQFDMSALKETLCYYDLPFPEFLYIDSITYSRATIYAKSNSLSSIADSLSINLEEHHNALSDALTCAHIIIKSVLQSRFKTFYTYLNFYNIKIKKSSELVSNKTFMRKPSSINKVSITELKTEIDDFNEEHPLYCKTCVITGDLMSFDRQTAFQKILDLGGTVKSSVSKKTHYLIVGNQDKSLVGESGISSKERKAKEFIEKGVDIKIINENEFLELIKE